MAPTGRLLVAAALACAVPLAIAPAAPAAATTYELAIPAPTGPAPVGASTLHLVDSSRPDPWVPASGPRQLMVTMYYPAVPFGRPAPYMTPAESEALLAFRAGLGYPVPPDLPRDVLADIPTHAKRDAPPLPGKRPLVLLSPGFTFSRSSLTALATELASRGYIVAAVDHTFESAGIELPDGTVAPCVVCQALDAEKIPPVRATDLSFVLDRLLASSSGWRHRALIDQRHIGVAGHSIGGNSAAEAMAHDRRIDAGVNLDGTFFVDVAEGFDRPFLMLGTARHVPGGYDDTWDRAWAELTGPRYWVAVDGAGHSSFTDFPPILEQLGYDDPESTLAGDRAVLITRAYVRAFFDRHLRGLRAPLLDGPSPRFPEVSFHSP
jgi:predicted dienelactone hydrolase